MYDAALQAQIEERRRRGHEGHYTVDTAGAGGESHREGQSDPYDNSANAPAYQPADPLAPRSNIPQATNKDVRGKGHYGIRGWMNKHPLGVIGAFIAAAAGGAYGLGGASAFGGGGAAGSTGGGLGVFSNGGTGGMGGVGGGNAGALANSGGIGGGAGMGGAGGCSMMGQNKMPQIGQQQQQPKNTWLADELARQEKEKEVKKQIAEQLGTKYV